LGVANSSAATGKAYALEGKRATLRGRVRYEQIRLSPHTSRKKGVITPLNSLDTVGKETKVEVDILE